MKIELESSVILSYTRTVRRGGDVLKERELNSKLQESMTDDQRQQFEEYLIAATATQAVVESLSYKQGMKDLLAFLKCIEYREDD